MSEVPRGRRRRRRGRSGEVDMAPAELGQGDASTSGPGEDGPPGDSEPDARGEGPPPGQAEPWASIEALFAPRVVEGEDSPLRLEWERHEVFAEPEEQERPESPELQELPPVLERVRRPEPNLEVVLRRLDDVSHWMGSVEQRIRDLAEPLGTLGQVPPQYLLDRLQVLSERLDVFWQDQESSARRSATDLGALQEGIAELGTTVRELREARGSEIESRGRLNVMLERLELLERTIDERMEALRDEFKDVGAAVADLRAAPPDTGLGGEFDALRGELGAVRGDLDAVRTEVRDVGGEVREVAGGVGELRESSGMHEGEEGPRVSVLIERLEVLEHNLEEIRTRQEQTGLLAANAAASAESAATSAESALADLRPMIERLAERGFDSEDVLRRFESMERSLASGTGGEDLGSTLQSAIEQVAELRDLIRTTGGAGGVPAALAERLDALESAIREPVEVSFDPSTMDEPLWQIGERLSAAEATLAEVSDALHEGGANEAQRSLVEQVNAALSRDPFELVSSSDLEELTGSITEKVRGLSRRVDRMESILDRGLSGIEAARRAAVEASQEMAKSSKQLVEEWRRVEKAQKDAARAAASSKRPAAGRAAPKRSPARRPPRPG